MTANNYYNFDMHVSKTGGEMLLVAGGSHGSEDVVKIPAP